MSLSISYLSRVTVAEHDGIVRQIQTKLQASGITNEMFTQRVNDFVARVAEEDTAYRQSQKDFNSDTLKAEDDLCDKYVKAVRAILNGHAELPVSEPNYGVAVQLLQVFKDYNFSPSDTYTAEADKVRNMNQVFQSRLTDLQTLGVKDYWTQVVAHATNMEQLLSQRFSVIAAQNAGAMKAARTNSDRSLKAVYELLSAMNVMMPSTQLTDLIAELDAIETYACQYYLGGKKASAASGNASSGSGSESGSGTGTTTPENPGNTGTGGDNTGGDNTGGTTPPGGDDDDPTVIS